MGAQSDDERSEMEEEVDEFFDDVEKAPMSSGSSNTSSLRASPSFEVLSFMLVFFVAMIGHELAIEAATIEFPNLYALPYATTLFQFGFCVLIPLATSRGRAIKTFPKSPREATPYIGLSIIVFGATALSSMSLQYVSYPTKVVFKSAKLIPTMIVSTIVHSGSKYGPIEYFAAFLLCAGAAGYSFGGGHQDGKDSSPGIILLTISVICDALVPNMQQKLMAEPTIAIQEDGITRPTPLKEGLSASELMINVNIVGFVGVLIYMVITGHLVHAITVAILHPRLLVLLTLIGLGLGTAVLAYIRLIQSSGSVAAVAVGTLRKVATVILSYIIFPKTMLPIHVFSGLSVLTGILLSVYGKRIRK